MKILFTLLLCLVASWARAQAPDSLKLPIDPSTKRITYAEVVQVPGVSQAELYTRAKLWFADSFKSAKDVMQADEREAGIVQGTGWSPIEAHFMGKSMRSTELQLWYTVKLACREGRYRYEITRFQHDVGTATEQSPMEDLIETWEKTAASKGKKPNRYAFTRDELKMAVAATASGLATSITATMARKAGTPASGKEW